MDIKYNRLLIFDGSFVLHRALSVPNNWDMITSYGKRTGGIFASLRTILKEIKMFNYCPVVVFDGGLSKRRLSIYPNYKRVMDKQYLYESNYGDLSQEEQLEVEFRREYNTQRNDIIPILRDIGIPVINIKDWEGDDIIYILTRISKDSIVVSEDKDLYQLVCEGDRRCRIRRPIREELIDNKYFKDNCIDTNNFVGCKAICGDGSDNIPSACYQVGEKTAPGLYQLYTHLNGQPFPSNENELSKVCEQYHIPKRKAYLNFNEYQFISNLLLMDLRYVDQYVDEDLFNSILTSINDNTRNLNEAIHLLTNFEINSFNLQDLLNRLNNLVDLKNLNTDVSHIPDINEIKQGLF